MILAYIGRGHKKLAYDPNDKKTHYSLDDFKKLNEARSKARKCKKCINNDGGFCKFHSSWCYIVNAECNFKN